MARPVKRRRVCELPSTSVFSPNTTANIEILEMAIDEYEVIRLIDHLGLNQNECALQMNVARTTVQAIYDNARKKIADALVNSKQLVIRGGSYELCAHAKKCCGKNCNQRECKIGQCESGDFKCNGCTCSQ